MRILTLYQSKPKAVCAIATMMLVSCPEPYWRK